MNAFVSWAFVSGDNVRGVSTVEAGLTVFVCLAAILALRFIGLQLYSLGLPAVLALLLGLCQLPRDEATLRRAVLSVGATCGFVYALFAVGITFWAALVLGLLLAALGTGLWLLHVRLSAVHHV
jgi:hypothetical protein